MDVTPANLSALRTLYSQIFQEEFLKQEINWNKLCTMVSSKSGSETYVWMDRIPQLRKWVGDRLIRNAELLDYELTNLPFELTEELDKHRIEDNKINAFEPTVRMMAEQAKKWPDTLLFAPSGAASPGAMANGQNVITYDGVGFFATNHPVSVSNAALGTQRNYYASGFALTGANYNSARSGMRALKGADNLPLGVSPNLLVVPPALEATAIQILKDQWIAPAAAIGMNAASVVQGNPFVGTADILVVPDLGGDDTTWYLLDTRGAVKPFLFQLRQAANFVMKTRPDDPTVFSRHAFQYGVDVRGNVGYGPWFKAFKATA